MSVQFLYCFSEVFQDTSSAFEYACKLSFSELLACINNFLPLMLISSLKMLNLISIKNVLLCRSFVFSVSVIEISFNFIIPVSCNLHFSLFASFVIGDLYENRQTTK